MIRIIALTVTILSGVLFPATGNAPAPHGGFAGIHPAVDITAPTNTPVFAGMAGRVIYAGWSDKGYGNLVIVQGSQYQTWYSHLQRIAVGVSSYVGTHTIIGYIGVSGNSNGPHLHWEIRTLDGCSSVNPFTGAVVSGPKNFKWRCGETSGGVTVPVAPKPVPQAKPKPKYDYFYRASLFHFKRLGDYIR